MRIKISSNDKQKMPAQTDESVLAFVRWHLDQVAYLAMGLLTECRKASCVWLVTSALMQEG